MARNPKQDENLKPIKKGELTKEEAKKRGSSGGKKSGEVRREKRDAREAARYILGLAAKGQVKENLKNLGVGEESMNNMEALQARLLVMALGGNLDAYKELMIAAGYNQEENRKERESIASDRRRDIELDAKVKALGQNPEGNNVSVGLANEEGGNDVVIYLPKLDPLPEEAEEEQTNDPE